MDLWKRVLLKYPIIMVFIHPFSSFNFQVLSEKWRGYVPVSFQHLHAIGQFQLDFSALITRSFLNLYPLTHPSRWPLVLGSGQILILEYIQFPTLSTVFQEVYSTKHLHITSLFITSCFSKSSFSNLYKFPLFWRKGGNL